MVMATIDPEIQAIIIDELRAEVARLRKTVEEQARKIKEQARIIEEWKRGHQISDRSERSNVGVKAERSGLWVAGEGEIS